MRQRKYIRIKEGLIMKNYMSTGIDPFTTVNQDKEITFVIWPIPNKHTRERRWMEFRGVDKMVFRKKEE